ncbi:pteridine reductase [Shewanella waksmanii]|uniref:pteridine reductase n=1 Tax=Shewanella waksmanii TaxID=213783 RepID=UPI00049141D0|nr:pteridine reductase [Shewanella waksmanii]
MQAWALITGAARRIGKQIATHAHQSGYNVIIHCNNNSQAAQVLAQQLNGLRAYSAVVEQADLSVAADLTTLIDNVASRYPALSLLVNNASVFYPTAIVQSTTDDIDSMLAVNLVAPYRLATGLKQVLASNSGCIVNLIDIHADKPLSGHGLYSISKAGLKMATLSLAQELAPNVRVNGVSPGAILWPTEGQQSQIDKVIEDIPLRHPGRAEDIADAVMFLVNASYITGQIIAVDGGRSAVGYQGAVE